MAINNPIDRESPLALNVQIATFALSTNGERRDFPRASAKRDSGIRYYSVAKTRSGFLGDTGDFWLVDGALLTAAELSTQTTAGSSSMQIMETPEGWTVVEVVILQGVLAFS